MARIVQVITGWLVFLLGLFFIVAGGFLAWLGGSLYYVIAGVLILISGLLVLFKKPSGTWLFMVVWIGTVLWSVYEVRFDPLQLMPRLVMHTVLLVLLISSGWKKNHHRPYSVAIPMLTAGVGLTLLTGVMFNQSLQEGSEHADKATHISSGNVLPTGEKDDDWSEYGGTLSGRRYSSLNDIKPENIQSLHVAWTQRTSDLPDNEEIEKHTHEVHSEATPIHVGNKLFTCTPHSFVQAIDDSTGKTLWSWKESADRTGNGYLVCRGVSYYEAPVGETCPHRIFASTYQGHIVALDAETGKLCSSFGNNGKIDLLEKMGTKYGAEHLISTSAPTVVNNRLIIGTRVSDGVDRIILSGVVRAYDPVNGKLVWAWDVGRSENAVGPLPEGETYTPGTPNVWGPITADAKNGVVYLGTGNASPDYYIGERRPFDDKFGTSIVALDAETGALRWHRQLVHRDMWDMDIPVGPSLFDYRDEKGTTIPALIQTTKMGQVYFLNRLTGEPISPIAELPVPTTGGVPGVAVSPTQPYSVGMPSFSPPAPTEIATWGATPIDQLLCRIDFHQAQSAGMYQPIGFKPMIGHPAFNGITDWGGAAIDPVRGIMTINTMEVPFKLWLAPRDGDSGKKWIKEARPGENAMNTLVGPQFNTPYIALVKAWVGVFGAPCLAPPWGKITAVDLNTRKVVWSEKLGTARDTGLFSTHLGLPIKMGVPNIGGSIITAGGVSFIGATTDQYLRAFDVKSGKEIWKARLPAGAQATPMTYRGGDGKQYVVITAGGHGAMGTRFGDYTIAFALPKNK